MANIRKWLERAIEKYGEPIEAIVVGKHDKASRREPPSADENVILTPEAGLTKLDEEFYDGYGGADCYPMYAWTATRVFFIGEYDGATGLSWVPRHPTATEPQFSGQ
jgi:hypothetical protein